VLEPTHARVGLLVPRFTVFDGALGPERVERLRARHALLAATIEAFADVVAVVTVEDEADATRARQAFQHARVEVVVVAPSMAAPPSLGAAVLTPPAWPAVLWNAIAVDGLAPDADQPTAIEHTTTVGCQMLAGALARGGIPVTVVSTAPGDPGAIDALRRAVQAVSVVGALRGASFVRVGQPPAGYLNVECTDDDLALLGARLVDVGPDELDEAFDAAGADEAGALLAGLSDLGIRTPPGIDAGTSARLAHAIGSLLDRHDAIAASVNCLGPLLRANEHIGIPACLAGARETALGRPVSCTGDIPAAIALWIGRRLTGAALYAEWYLSQVADGDALLLSCGLADVAFARPGTASLYAVTSVPGVNGVASGVRFDPRTGPATLIGLGAAADGWRIAWLEGEAVGAASPNLRGVAVRFAADGLDPLAAASRFIAAGVTHHPVLVPGRIGAALRILASALGVSAYAEGARAG
jgi:L-fucose isomerase-like protein